MTSRPAPKQSLEGGIALQNVRAPITTRATSPSSLGAVSNTTDNACLEAYQRELDYLMRTLQRLGVASEDLEDLAHEVFLVLRSTWRDYDPARALRPYLFGIAFRVASSHRRRYWREVSFESVDGQDLGPVPDQAVEASQARALVLAALQRLPLPRRVVLMMHELDEIPIREVASTLGIPLFTAYSRLRKARRELEAALRHAQPRSLAR
jgi:RNA polymerase sigma-70 factor (ECF subfamily)